MMMMMMMICMRLWLTTNKSLASHVFISPLTPHTPPNRLLCFCSFQWDIKWFLLISG